MPYSIPSVAGSRTSLEGSSRHHTRTSRVLRMFAAASVSLLATFNTSVLAWQTRLHAVRNVYDVAADLTVIFAVTFVWALLVHAITASVTRAVLAVASPPAHDDTRSDRFRDLMVETAVFVALTLATSYWVAGGTLTMGRIDAASTAIGYVGVFLIRERIVEVVASKARRRLEARRAGPPAPALPLRLAWWLTAITTTPACAGAVSPYDVHVVVVFRVLVPPWSKPTAAPPGAAVRCPDRA